MTVSSVKTGDLGISFALNNNYMEPIATTLVGSGGVNQVTFNDIPQTYKHLQIRGIARSTKNADGRSAFYLQLNSDNAVNYSSHNLIGDGTSASSDAVTTQPYMLGVSWMLPSATATANVFGGFILDILDYANTSKYKTVRNIIGSDFNSTTPLPGRIGLESSSWRNTDAITSIKFYTDSGNWAQYSRFSLYGIKG
jgi:hypothetical protein